MARSMSQYRQNGVDYIINDPNIAPVFVPTNSPPYLAGQYVKHEGLLYRFLVDHTGAWDASHVVQVLLGAEVGAIGVATLIANEDYNVSV